MRHAPDMLKLEADVARFFSSELLVTAKKQAWTHDRQWTDGIHQRMCEIGHSHAFLVFASKSRCVAADGPEWLYDHHWRVSNDENTFIRIPLVMEIEWGFGAKTIFGKIVEDFQMLVLARADLRVMVFQCDDVASVTDKLIAMVENFEGSQQGDRWLFAGFDWGTDNIYCRLSSM
jgi:hypothetical protein